MASLMPSLHSQQPCSSVYRCAIEVAHSDSSRALKVAHSVHCRAFEIARSVYCCAVKVAHSAHCRAVKVARSLSSCAITSCSQLIFSPLRLHSQVYCCTVKVACSVDCRAATFIIAPIAQLSSSPCPSRVHLNHRAVALIGTPIV